MGRYPYYIVTWTEGRLKCPEEWKRSPLRRQFEKGIIGGRKNREERVETPQEALRIVNEDRMERRVYVVQAPQTPRRGLRYDELVRLTRKRDED
jgi:hypothetical protein